MNRRITPTMLGGEEEKAPLKQIPFPGLIDGHKWRVKEGRWPVFIDRSDLEGEGGLMHVPLEDTDVGRKLRLHEQAHVQFTPEEEVVGVDPKTVEACEDGRIIHLMNQRHDWRQVNTETQVMPESVIKRHAEDFNRLAQKLAGHEDRGPLGGAMPTPTIPLIQAARLLAMTRGYREAHDFDRMAATANLDWLKDHVNELHDAFLGKKDRPTFEDTVNYARELERSVNELERSLQQANADLEAANMHERLHEPPESFQKREREEFVWGKMTTETAPLTEKLRADPSRKQRPNDMGAVPRYMHRLLTDQRVFGRRRKRVCYQGTVLIDHSGSMSLSDDELTELLARWPAVTIATYCGSGSGHGKLRIIAKNGKRATGGWLNRPGAGANEIDGPALDWLKKQKQPRIWITDGGVSGAYENFHPWFSADAAKKVRQGRIKRIDYVEQLLT